MRNAAEERGNFLDDLGDSLNNMHVSASNYLTSARNTAVSLASLQLVYDVVADVLVDERSCQEFRQERVGQDVLTSKAKTRVRPAGQPGLALPRHHVYSR